MRSISAVLATVFLTSAFMPRASAAQGNGFVPASRELFSLDFAAEPMGQFPKRLTLLRGKMVMVMKDGVPALRASDPSEFLISLPERLPQDFTLEFDLIPKSCCNPSDLAFEGTPVRDRGPLSMEVEWHPDHLMATGGGPMFQTAMPDELKPTLPSQLTEIRATFQGNTFTLYTNDKQLYTIDRRFVRGRVLRVSLGGQDDARQAVFLTRLRVATNAAPPAGQAPPLSAGQASRVASTGTQPTSPPPPPPPPLSERPSQKPAPTPATGPTAVWASSSVYEFVEVLWKPVAGAVTYSITRIDNVGDAERPVSQGEAARYTWDWPLWGRVYFCDPTVSDGQTIRNPENCHYADSKVVKGTTYTYRVYAIFQNGVVSPPSQPATAVFK